MEQGFIVEYTGGSNRVSTWVPGAPQKSFWTHTKVRFDETVPIGVFRCKSCGFLESYARDEFAAQ
jgi:hypothetical protein